VNSCSAQVPRPVVLLCWCAPAYSHDDTVLCELSTDASVPWGPLLMLGRKSADLVGADTLEREGK
jgi:hypothetical protein